MPPRKGVRERPNPSLETELAKVCQEIASVRSAEAKLLDQRNSLLYRMFHGNGYTQRRLMEIGNTLIDPSDPNAVTEATVEKALLRMR